MDFFTTHISAKANDYINSVLETTHISAGKKAEEFEEKLSEYLGLINPVSLNSGTSSLHLALLLAGVKPGDEVILSPQTFIASGLSVLMTGAKPVFVDIQYETGNIEPSLIEKKITHRTKAIMPVHWGGYPCDMDEITDIAKKNGLVVIEDAAHALGASYKNKPIGSLSDFTCFSFQSIKHITTGDGGAVCCKDSKDFEQAKNIRWFGIDRKNSKPSILGEREYDLKELGYKYHMNDLAASLGLANLEDINYILKRRREIAAIYHAELGNIAGLQLFDYKSDRESAYWLFSMHVEHRERFIRKLNEKKIPASIVHAGINKNSIFGETMPNLFNQEKFDESQISIPVHSDLSDNEVELIISTIKSGW